MRIRGWVSVVVALGGMLVFGAVPAGAATGYGDVCGLLGGPGLCATGTFAFPAGVAVDNSANPSSKGDVYVVDVTKSRVLKFNAAGEPVSFEATGTPELNGGSTPKGSFSTPAYIAAGPSGDIYVENVGEPVIDVFNAKGEYVPQAPGAFVAPSFEGGSYAPFGVGVDQENGEVYVADHQAGGVIDVFEEDGTFLRTFPTGAGGSDSVAVNAAGDVYVDNENTSVTEFSATGTPLGTLDARTPQAVAVDPSNQDVFVGENGSSASYQIAEYAAPGAPGEAPLAVFGSGDFASNGSYGIAVSAAPPHRVYASNAAGEAGLIFEEGPQVEAVTEAPTEVGSHTALLHGTVNQHASAEEAVEYYFAYNRGPSCEGAGQTEKQTTTVTQGTAVAVSGEVSGLLAGDQYTVCLAAKNSFGTTLGPPVSFTTTGVPPVIESESASVETASETVVSAVVNPEDQATTCVLQYVTEAAFNTTEWAGASSIPCSPQGLGEGGTGVPVAAHVTGLSEGASYEYRVLARNAFSPAGGTPGPTQAFQMLLRPAVSGESASRIVPRGALLSASVNPNGVQTTYHFAYGPTAGYGVSAPASDIGVGEGSEGQQALVGIEGLQPGTTYHYALVASSRGGVRVGPDQTFTTPPPLVPLVSTGAASEVSQNATVISGTVDPQGVPTSYEFDIGTDTTYGTRVSGSAGSGTEASTLTLGLQALAAGTLYHYRLVATNTYGTVYGVDETFTTPGFPTSLLASPAGAPLVPTPVFTAPSVEGAITASQTPGKNQNKPKGKKQRTKKTRRRGGKAGGAPRVHGRGRSGR